MKISMQRCLITKTMEVYITMEKIKTTGFTELTSNELEKTEGGFTCLLILRRVIRAIPRPDVPNGDGNGNGLVPDPPNGNGNGLVPDPPNGLLGSRMFSSVFGRR